MHLKKSCPEREQVYLCYHGLIHYMKCFFLSLSRWGLTLSNMGKGIPRLNLLNELLPCVLTSYGNHLSKD